MALVGTFPTKSEALTFGDVTSPATPEEFFSAYWTRRAVHLRDPRRTFDEYFGWGALNALLNSGALTFPTTTVSREERVIPAAEFTRNADSRVVDAAGVVRLFREGASFSIRAADSHWPPLKSIIAGLYEALGETVHTNVYCSPANIQGFRCHYDLHEVFVLQIEGAKRWRIFEPTSDFPVEPWRPEDAPDDSVAPYLDVVLSSGDVLYVPRGHWHYAVAQDSPSLHITVGVTCRKGDSFLDWLGPQLLSDASWRRNVPPMGGPTRDGSLPRSTAAFVEWANELRRALLDKLSEPDLLERFATDIFVGTSPAVSINMPLDGAAAPLPVEDLVFDRPAGQRHVIQERTDGSVVLKAGGVELELEGVSRELLAGILGASSIRLEDIDTRSHGATREEIAELLETLVRAGLLVARPRSDAV